MSARALAIVLAAATGAVLAAMVVVSIATGAAQEPHEHVRPVAEYMAGLLAHPGGLRAMMGLDVAFLVLYTAFFAALAQYLRALGRPFVSLALGALVATALLDIVEDHHILAMLSMAEQGRPPDEGSLVLQEVISSTKFSISYLGLFLYGLAVPRTSRLAWALSLFLTAGTLATAVAGYAAPAGAREALEGGRWIGFLIGFVLAAAWLRRAPDVDRGSE
jgi:hypothetical protein